MDHTVLQVRHSGSRGFDTTTSGPGFTWSSDLTVNRGGFEICAAAAPTGAGAKSGDFGMGVHPGTHAT